LTSTDTIYKKLAKICGSNFQILPDGFNVKKLPKTNIIFCDGNDETHYKYFNLGMRKIADSYSLFQMRNSHGNCFAFALYASRVFSTGDEDELVNIFNLLEEVEEEITNNKGLKIIKYFKKVKDDKKQLAYKCYVHNDYSVINWLIELIEDNNLKNLYSKEWSTISEYDKNYYGIPLDPSYTFDIYLNQFKILAKDIKNVFPMVYEVATTWDDEKDNLFDYENCGIEGAKQEIDENDYLLTDGDISSNSLVLMGGGRGCKREVKNKSRIKKTKMKKSMKKGFEYFIYIVYK